MVIKNPGTWPVCGARPHDGNKDSAGSTETHGDRPGTRSGNKLL